MLCANLKNAAIQVFRIRKSCAWAVFLQYIKNAE